MKTNISLEKISGCAKKAKAIRTWFDSKNHPENYQEVEDLECVRDFVHTIDLLETVLCRFEIQARLTELALKDMESIEEGALGWEFFQIDVEETFASSFMELTYQLSNAWKELDKFTQKSSSFEILGSTHVKLSSTFLARHKATHFDPDGFQRHEVSREYAILRRPYSVKDGVLEKGLVRHTAPKTAKLIRDAFGECNQYLDSFLAATCQQNDN
ncbi:hypothetical protein [Agarivorans sp. Alg241-V36]|uniref:hypothetical protein n=1 Tax=Agarivorans sp. Alg241-V36 TaxID=2305992 RepID=UPI0013D2604E|nr:hypothetical protein [Agarivorans sp. Alg241-V36]